MLVGAAELIKIGVSAVVFALSLVGNTHFKGLLNNANKDENPKAFKKLKRKKTLCFSGVVISIWFAIGVFVTWFSGKKSGEFYRISLPQLPRRRTARNVG